tara:strand:- start:2205 stop:2651 length:447 start_codon:yes stop_codon:yes gene_type:complete
MSISKLEINILYDFFDLIIPSNEKMPPASEIISEEEVLKLLSTTDKYDKGLSNLVSFIRKEPTARVMGGPIVLNEKQRSDILALMESIIPDDFSTLIETVYLLYYSKSEIHEKINWNTEEESEENKMKSFDPSILKNVSKKTPFWKKV